MAGQPKRDAAIKALYQLSYDEIGPTAMPIDWVVQEIAAAKTIPQIAKRIAEHTDGWLPSRGWLSGLLKSLTPDAAERIEQARVESAEALVERATETLEDVGKDASREELQKAKALADIDLWLAARRDRAKFGDTPQVQIGISAGSLHLDALRAVQPRQSRPELVHTESLALPSSSPQDGAAGDEAAEAQGNAA